MKDNGPHTECYKPTYFNPSATRYGDKYPKSILGKIMGSVWIVLGMLFVTMFIGTLTTTLMTLLLEGTYNIQDQKVIWIKGLQFYDCKGVCVYVQ